MKKKTSRSTLHIELEPEKRDGKASRNSWAEIYHNNTVLRKSLKLLGEDVVMDDWLDWRVKWGQRGVGFFGLIGLICWTISDIHIVLTIASSIFSTTAMIFGGILYYKNISLVIMKRLLKEANVVVIIILTICNWVIDIGRPTTPLSPLMGLVFLLVINLFLFVDALKVKSRIFVLFLVCISVFLNLVNVHYNIFTNANQGIVLFNYTIQGEENTIMKRSTKRSIFLQILLFSMTAVYTIFKDKKMKFMLFATGNIYRETGTASKEVEDKTFSMEIKLEKEKSIDQARV